MPRGTGLQKQLNLSDDMAAFMGKSTASRAQIMRAVWDHIKKHGLQSESDRRTVEPDDVLAPILGSRPLSMFKIAQKISDHVEG